MISGNAMIWVAAVATLISLLGYIGVSAGKRGYLGTARTGFLMMTAALAVANGMLLQAFLSRRFDLEYVFSYSSNELSRYYTISAFWAGQEGTFLLWALLGAVMGVCFLLRAREDEGVGMVVMNAVQIFILVLMLKKSPFAPVSADLLMRMGLQPGQVPGDGQGLNPLLQDPWMAIHPPLVFLGYAALAIPFAMAISALVRRDYDGWVKRSLPWTAFAWASLGSGIFVGGYWAYKVLGWGGYWGWDPVENASLIPWLTATALLHGMLTQRAIQGMRRTNLALAVFSFMLVIYGTFLTRSGVLGDFSVHSFSDLGLNAYLVVFMLGFLAASLGLLFGRWKDIPNPESNLYGNTSSREFAFLLTVLVLSISAVLVLVGTSSPLITGLMAKFHLVKKASNVDTPYYLWTNTPVGILLAVLLSLCPLMAWKGSGLRDFAKIARGPALFAFAMSVGAVLMKSESVAWVKAVMVITVALGAFALGLNALILFPRLKGDKILTTGGYVAHLGLALMLIGIVGSFGYSLHHRIALAQGESKSAFGYKFTFDGLMPDPRHPNKATMDVRVEKGSDAFIAKPAMEQNVRTGEIMKKPHIRKFQLSDLYIIPQDYQPGVDSAEFTLVKGDSATEVAGYRIKFIGFEVPQHGMESGAMSVGARLEISKDGKTEQVVPMMEVGDRNTRSTPMKFFGGAAAISLNRISVEQHSATLSMAGPGIAATPEIAVIEVSTKPLVNFVWLGTILMVLGGCIAAVRRARETRPKVVPEPVELSS